jgi:cell division septum initiation protein DivIVA
MTYLLFAVALALSAVAGWYAIAGLIAIFAASVIPIAIMGSLLEVSKLVVASWLYRSWKHIPFLMKSYFTIALITLMLLTSMGIFGFLSKAHLDQAVPTGDLVAKLEMVDEKIKTQRENLDASRQAIAQLDKQVNETINRSTNTSGAERSVQIRRNQQAERTRILKDIGAAQTEISKLQQERAPIATEVRKVEAEVGPIKYIAQLIYGEEAKDGTLLEKAVRFVILMIVFVFDPLAVLMLVAANWQMNRDRQEKRVSAFPTAVNDQITDSVTVSPPPVEVPVDDPPEPPKPLPEEAKPILHKFFSKVKVTDKIKVEPQIEPTTIVEEVDSLQHHQKGVDYDSLGRRITP